MKKIYFILIVIVLSLGLNAQNVFTVTKTTDPDPFQHPYNNVDSLCDADMYGTLQWAIRKTNDATSASTIEFNISGSGVQTINLNGYLPQIIKPVIIDATTQTGYVKGSPTVVINGNDIIANGLNFYHVTNYTVKGIGIKSFTDRGIRNNYSTNITISDCVINGIHAVPVLKDQKLGVAISFYESTNATVYGNLIGFELNANNNGISDAGIATFQNSSFINIGAIFSDKQNTIRNCEQAGILIGKDTKQNKISGNIIYDNLKAIYLNDNANEFKKAPDSLVYHTDNNLLTGKAKPNDIIEIFGSTGDENANEYLTTVTADASGNWQTNTTTTYDYFVATATDASGNTSELSDTCYRSINVYDCYCFWNYYAQDYNFYCDSDTVCAGEPVYFTSLGNSNCIGDEIIDYGNCIPLATELSYTTVPIYNTTEYLVSFIPTNTGVFEITISNPCMQADSCTSTFILTVLPPPTVTITADPVCSGQELILTADEDFISYEWSNNVDASALNFAWDTPYNNTSVDIVNNYSVTITDENGCRAIDTIGVTVWPEPTPIISGNSICIGDTTTIGVTNTYISYAWNTGQITPDITVSPTTTTTYTVTVTDANGCEGTASYTVTVNTPPNISLDITNNCQGQVCEGTAEVFPQTMDMNYQWSTGAIAPPNYDISNLCDGNYSVTATDNNGCSTVETFTITTNPNPTIGLQAIDNSNVCNCNGVAAIYYVNPGGPVPPPVSYVLSPQNGYLNIINPTAGDLAFEGLCNEDYTLTVTDGNGCSSIYDFLIDGPEEITITETITNVTCFGDEDGSISINVSGGVAPYNYSWSSGGSADTETDLGAGTYSVTVTDANNCSVVETYTITEPSQITFTTSSTDNSNCTGNCNGTATVNPSGGTAPYSFIWNDDNAQTNQTANGLCADTFYVTVTDANGCSTIASVTVNDDPNMYNVNADFTITSNECYAVGGSPVTIQYYPSTGVNYSFDFADGSANLTNPSFQFTHNFEDYGYMCITLNADNGCATATHSETIYVNESECACEPVYDISDGTVYDSGLDVIWDENTGANPEYILVEGDVFVTNNTTLKINDITVIFAPKARIIIDKGVGGVDASKLIINNSILTGVSSNIIDGLTPDCDLMWQGIEVWGNPFRESTELTNYHGIVNLKSSFIKNAHIAILSGARDLDAVCDYTVPSTNPWANFDWTKAGGIIIGLDDTLLANGIDILYLSKIGTGIEASENKFTNWLFSGRTSSSIFQLSDLHYDSDLPNPYPNQNNPWAGEANQYHVSTAGIIFNYMKGVDISNCDFQVKWHGIKSATTQFNIYDSHFLNTRYGIRIDENNPYLISSHEISRCTFTDISGVINLDGFGIGIFSGNFDLITDCQFTNFGAINTYQFGLRFDGATNLKVIENTFDNIETAIDLLDGKIGWIGAGETGSANDWQGNNFTNCQRGINTENDNSSVALKCNNHNQASGSSYDYTWNNIGDLADQGQDFGAVNDPAGNMFLNNSLKNIESNNSYSYYYHLYDNPLFNDYQPISTTNANTFSTGIAPGTNNQDRCQESYPAPIVMPALSFSVYPYSKLPELQSEKQDLQNQLDDINANIDGGITQELLSAIQAGGSQWRLRNLLIENSPLSDTVISTLLEEDALFPWFYFQVMASNTPVSRDVAPQFLEYNQYNVPWFLRRILYRLQGNNPYATTPTSVDRLIAKNTMDYNLLLADITRNLCDSTNNRVNDAIQVLEFDNSDASKKELFATYLQQENYTAAQQKLSELQGISTENDNFVQLGQILTNLQQQGKTIYQMDSSDFAFVHDLAYQCPAYDAVYNARSIVYVKTGEEIADCPQNMGNRSLEIFSDDNDKYNENETFPYLSLGENYPEPFRDYTTIPYELPQETTGKLVIKDMLGKTVEIVEIDEGYNEIKLDTKNWEPGVYIYTMEVEGLKIFSKKMVLSH